MSIDLDRVNQLLRFITTIPDAAHLVPALHYGPLACVDPVCSSLLRFVSDDTLEVVDHVGLPAEYLDRYHQLPVGADLPTPRAVRTGLVHFHDIGAVPRPGLARVDFSEFRQLATTLRIRSVIGIPVVHRGEPIGAISILSAKPSAVNRPRLAALTATASIVSLWLRHPDTQLPPPLRSAPEACIALSPRQRQVIQLLGRGGTIEQTAAALGVSASTVKQDLRRTMRATRASDRAEALDRARQFGLL